jgi:hypothetical protein
MHDMGEIVTGDIVLGNKTKVDEEKEANAILTVAEAAPEFISKEIQELFQEFENPQTPEGKFAKAVDKLEAPFWWGEICDLSMVKTVNTVEQRIKNEDKRKRMYEEYGFKFIALFGKNIYDRAVEKGLLKD